MSDVKIVFDIGGTKMRVGAVRGGKLDEVEIIDTAKDPTLGFQQLIELSKKAAKGDSISEFCGGMSGVIQNGIVLKSPNLSEWIGANISRILEEEFNTKATFLNDAELVGLGEYFYGAGQGSKTMVYVTVSTGVGGCLIEEGEIQRGEFNAEIGHQLVGDSTLEEQISGVAIEKKYGKKPGEITDHKIWESLAETLAKGLYDNVLHWSPDTIVLGGSMITGERNVIPINHVEETLRKLVKTIYPHAPSVKKARLSKLGGLYGGMAYLFQQETETK